MWQCWCSCRNFENISRKARMLEVFNQMKGNIENCYWRFKSNSSWKFIDSEPATRGVLWKNVFLEISQNSQENNCARVSFLIQNTFLQNTSGRLLLLIKVSLCEKLLGIKFDHELTFDQYFKSLCKIANAKLKTLAN